MDIHKSRLFAESWNVAYRKKSSEGFPKDLDTPFTVIRNSYRYWAADPFVFEKDGETYIFAELYDYLRKRGAIGYCRLSDPQKTWTPVIRESFHLSYPYLFSRDGQIYMIPESSQNASLLLYRAVRFPDLWEKVKVLRNNVRYVDTTPFSAFGKDLALSYDLSDPCLRILDFSDGQDRVADDSSPELKRPAGHIDFDRRIRAAQDCSVDYGKGLVFYRFDLGEDMSYSEREILRIYPEDLQFSGKYYLDGMHTYHRSEHCEVVDVKTRRFNLLNLAVRTISKLK